MPVFPSTDFVRKQLRLSAINGDEDHEHSNCDDGSDDQVQEQGITWDRLRRAVVAEIRRGRPVPLNEPVELSEQKVLGFDDDNDFVVVSERVVAAPSQCGVGAGLGAYALGTMEHTTAISLYSSGSYFLNLEPRDPDGTYKGSQRQLDDDELALSHSAYRFLFPEVIVAGIKFRIGIDADPRSPHTRASLQAYQTMAAQARLATSRVQVSAGCGARVNHSVSRANAECVFFTARGPSGKVYPLAGQPHISSSQWE